MKILVLIANYGLKNQHYLEKVIAEYKSFPCEIDIVVLSNIMKKLPENVQIRVGIPIPDPWSLPFAYKPELVKNAGKYDLYIYSEDDMVVTYKNVKAFLEMTSILPDNEIAGFIRQELDSNGETFYCDIHKEYHWVPESVKKIGLEYFAELTNEHAAVFMVTDQQLSVLLKKDTFLRGPVTGYYDMLVTAATEPYTVGGLRKFIPISRIEDFTLHHLSNKYCDGKLIYVIPKKMVQLQIQKMISDYGKPGVNTTLFPTNVKMERIQWHKKYYDGKDEILIKMVGAKKSTILSYGMGGGANEIYLSEMGHSITAFPLDTAIATYALICGIKIIFDLSEIGKQKYDIIILNDILQYIKKPEKTIDVLSNLLNQGGRIIGVVPNHLRFVLFNFSLPSTKKNKDLWKLLSYSYSGIKFMSVFSLFTILKKTGFKIEKIEYDLNPRATKLNMKLFNLPSIFLCTNIYFSASKIDK